jgi:hypothetical protein
MSNEQPHVYCVARNSSIIFLVGLRSYTGSTQRMGEVKGIKAASKRPLPSRSTVLSISILDFSMVKASIIVVALFSTMTYAAVIDPNPANSNVSVTEKRDYSGSGEYFAALPQNLAVVFDAST